jgi:hypothetical protein
VNASKILFLIAFCVWPFLVFGQKPIVPEKKIYSSPTGRLYVQKSLPLYMHMDFGTDDKKNSALLKNVNDPKNGNPIYLEKEGLNTFHSPYAVDPVTRKIAFPKQLVLFEVYADSRPPVTQIGFGLGKTANRDGKLYISEKAEITLRASDEISGVDKIYYSIDSADYKEYTSPIVLENEKEYTFQYYSTDHVGNMEKLKMIKLVVDKSKPRTTFEIKGDRFENVLSGRSVIVFNTSDNFSAIKTLNVKLDGKPLRSFSGSLHTSGLAEGDHKLEYYAENIVGNQEDTQVFDFYVDRTGPTILEDIIGKKFMSNGKEFSSGSSQLKLTALDNKAGVKAIYYSINKSEYKLYERPVFLRAVTGKISVRAYAVDKVNNKNQAEDEENSELLPYVDLTGPMIKYHLTGPQFVASDTIYISSKTKINFSGFDSESGLNNIQYIIDNKDPDKYSNPFSIAGEGQHSIDYIGTDNVDNTTTQNFKVLVDNTGPVLIPTFSTSPKGKVTENGRTFDVYPGHICLFIAATDVESGYDHMSYSLNGSPEKLFTGFLRGFPPKSNVTVKVYDKLGNETQLKLEFVVSK